MDERSLIALFQQKQKMQALAELYGRYVHLVSTLSHSILKQQQLTEDAVNDVFEIIARDLKTTQVQNFSSWLYSVTKFHCLKLKKKHQKEFAREDMSNEEASDDAITNLEMELKLQKRIALMKSSLGDIKEHQKTCIELFYLKGMSYHEVAEQTGFSVKEVKSYIQNGKRNLKNVMLDNE